MPRRLLIILAFLSAVAALSGGVRQFGLASALDQIAERGRADLGSASERLIGQLQRYRQVAVQLADHPELVSLASGSGNKADIRNLLLRTGDQSSSLSISFADTSGRILVSSDSEEEGLNQARSGAVRRALRGALGMEHNVLPTLTPGGAPEPRRAYSFAAPVFAGVQVAGAIIVRVDMEKVEESNWRSGREAIWFTDDSGLIFIANRPELLFDKRHPQWGGESGFQPLSEYEKAGLTLWRLNPARYLPSQAIHLVQPLPVIGLTGEALIDIAPAERIALLQALAVAGLCLAFGALLFLATERRRTLAEANATLEERVARRTEALTEVNDSLRREVREREEAEAALKRAQSDLVQAGKLSALGQMSAGISHELNQPLMAIGNFAENAETFLERGKPDAAASNLGRISELTHRMGRIIRNLRAFARQESEPVGRVDVVAAVNTAVELTEAHLRQGGVNLNWQPPEHPVFARAGEVRLVQVFVNLITNAVDAMADSEQRQVRIVINNGRQLAVCVRDTGPGIEEPEKMFDPFYSTKEVGQGGEEGMGLGLSISYGLVQSFGGAIRGRNVTGANGESRGAMLTVDLEYWTKGGKDGSSVHYQPDRQVEKAAE